MSETWDVHVSVIMVSPVRPGFFLLRCLPTETKVESGTSQSKSGTSVNLSNSGNRRIIDPRNVSRSGLICREGFDSSADQKGRQSQQCRFKARGSGPSSVSTGMPDYSQVDAVGLWYKSVNFAELTVHS